jgi:hypothetical protein
MTDPDTRTPAAIAMDEAIEAAITGDSTYPDNAAFLDADAPWLADAIARAADEGRAVVICYGDGSRRVLTPTPATAA